MNPTQRLRLALRVLTHRSSGLMRHAESELGPNMDIEVRELLHVFASQGHSGGSAAVTAALLGKLLRYEPIGPLTGEPDEWTEVGPGVFQNRRCSRVFKDAEVFGGQAYDLQGKVFREPNGACFTNRDSRVPVTFPYTPRTEYVDVPAPADQSPA